MGDVVTWAAVVGSVAANVVLLYREFNRSKMEVRRTTVMEYEQLLSDYRRQAARHETQLESHTKVISEVVEHCNGCEIDLNFLYAQMEILHAYSKRQGHQLKIMGVEMEEMPPMPARPERRQPSVDFLKRTADQADALGRAADVATQKNVQAIRPKG
jgi:hypothetical protein